MGVWSKANSWHEARDRERTFNPLDIGLIVLMIHNQGLCSAEPDLVCSVASMGMLEQLAYFLSRWICTASNMANNESLFEDSTTLPITLDGANLSQSLLFSISHAFQRMGARCNIDVE